MTSDARQAKPLVFYDGVCGLCDSFVQFLLGADTDGKLLFAPLQGTTAEELRRRGLLNAELDSMALVEGLGSSDERVSTHSTGALRTLAHLGGIWRAVSWLRIVPRPIRDLVYGFIARYRYRWFGRFDACKLPAPEVRARFLD